MEPKKRNAIALIVLSLGVLYYVWDYQYTDRKEALAEQQVRVEDLERSNRAAQLTSMRGGDEIEEQLAAYERHARRLEQLIPSAEEVPALLRSIQFEAGRAEVQVADFQPGIDEPGPYYTKQSYSLSVIGEYHDVGRFMTSIASLPRIITPINADLLPFEDQENLYPEMVDPVRVDFDIETYVVPESTGGPPPAEMGGEGGVG